MSRPQLAAAERAFLEAHLFSYEKLEVIHALRAKGQPMSSKDLQQECQLDRSTVDRVLEELIRSDLVARVRADSYAVAPSSWTGPCDRLLVQYAEDRTIILSALSMIAMDRIRNMAAFAFADAFVIRKKREDGDG